jgi:hypothetical protein
MPFLKLIMFEDKFTGNSGKVGYLIFESFAKLIFLFNHIRDFFNKTILILKVLAGGYPLNVRLNTIPFDQLSLQGIGLPGGDINGHPIG